MKYLALILAIAMSLPFATPKAPNIPKEVRALKISKASAQALSRYKFDALRIEDGHILRPREGFRILFDAKRKAFIFTTEQDLGSSTFDGSSDIPGTNATINCTATACKDGGYCHPSVGKGSAICVYNNCGCNTEVSYPVEEASEFQSNTGEWHPTLN